MRYMAPPALESVSPPEDALIALLKVFLAASTLGAKDQLRTAMAMAMAAETRKKGTVNLDFMGSEWLDYWLN